MPVSGLNFAVGYWLLAYDYSPERLQQDERLFQCGSQEAGLVKYDKYTCKNQQ